MSVEPTANIGVVGLAVMGSNLARNLASRDGNKVAVYNRTWARTEKLVDDHPEAGLIPSHSIKEFAASLRRPRTAIIMVQAGAGTEAVIDQLLEVFEPGDIIVDGGNTRFTDTIRREARIRPTGIHFVGTGISGGEEGALHGPSIMPGGSDESYRTLGPILSSIAAKAPDGEPCVTHIGTDGAGHFVKMVHNGIEYADMQLIAEAYDLLRNLAGLTPSQIADVFENWNSGDLNSYLIDITAQVLRHTDPATGEPFIDIVKDAAGAKGTGAWTVETALEFAVPGALIAEAVFARTVSSRADLRASMGDSRPVATPYDGLVEDIRSALFASKVVAYAQGFDEISVGARDYHWSIDRGAVAKIWRAGCIIRAQFLERIVDAYNANPKLPTLLTDPYFAKAVGEGDAAWRRVVSAAVAAGVPVPAFSSGLAYYDSLRARRLPAALIQGQRDYFGAHTYERTDRPGTFHTDWSGDAQEVPTEPSTH